MTLGKYALIMSTAAMLALAVPSFADPHEGDVFIGWTDFGIAGGPRHLAVEYDDFGTNMPLPAINGLLQGWAGDEPGFEALDADEPDEDFYTLPDGALIAIEILSVDTGFKIWKPGLAGLLLAGDTFTLGGNNLHAHLDWHIDSSVPGVNPELNAYGFSFRLLDLGTTGLLASPEYALAFVPEPTSLLLLALAAGLIRRR